MRTQKNNILWYSNSHIDRDEKAIISVWYHAEYWRAPDWLSLTCCRCDVTSDGCGGGGGVFSGKRIEEVRWDHSGLHQGTGGVLEPGPRRRKAKSGLTNADTNPVFRIWRGWWWSAGGRWNLYLCATHSPVCLTGTGASHGASITFIFLRQHTWMFWSPWLREAAWKWVFKLCSDVIYRLVPKEALILPWVHVTHVYVCKLTLVHVSTMYRSAWDRCLVLVQNSSNNPIIKSPKTAITNLKLLIWQ